MAWTAPMTAVANAVFTAAQFNTHVRDNLLETAPGKATTAGSIFVTSGANAIAERIPTAATVATDQSTTSTAFTDLSTVGPEVTVTTGTKAIVMYTTGTYNSGANNRNEVTYAVSGATTIAANGNAALIYDGDPSFDVSRHGSFDLVTGLTEGSNTFTMKYKTSAGTANFFDRHIIVIPL